MEPRRAVFGLSSMDVNTVTVRHTGLNMTDGVWLMWADPGMSRALSLEEIALHADDPEDGRYYGSHEWHVAHCMYNWKRQFRNRNTDVRMEKSLFTYHHIEHCEEVIRSAFPLNATSTISCVKLNSDDID